MKTKNILLLFLIFLGLINSQLNQQHLGFFLLVCLGVGLAPLPKMNFIKYLLIGLFSVLVCWAFFFPDIKLVEKFVEIAKMPLWAYLLLVMLVTSLTVAILANAVYHLITLRFFKKFIA